MPPIPLKAYIGLAVALAFAAALAWGFSWKHAAGKWEGKFIALTEQAGGVLAATRLAADNPKLEWQDTAEQINKIAAAHVQLKRELQDTNQTILEMAEEAVRRNARYEELQKLAARAKAQRAAALKTLAEERSTPGTVADCNILLKESEQVLDLIREASRAQVAVDPAGS